MPECSDLRTFSNTVISFLGSGVLGLPFAFKKCGILVRTTTRGTPLTPLPH